MVCLLWQDNAWKVFFSCFFFFFFYRYNAGKRKHSNSENKQTNKKTALAEDYVEKKQPEPHLGQFSELFLPVGTRQQYGFVACH